MFRHGCEYPMHTQARIALALTTLRNFIRCHDPADSDLAVNDLNNDAYVGGGAVNAEGEFDFPQNGTSRAERARATKRRDDIANAMWEDYQKVLRNGNYGGD